MFLQESRSIAIQPACGHVPVWSLWTFCGELLGDKPQKGIASKMVSSGLPLGVAWCTLKLRPRSVPLFTSAVRATSSPRRNRRPAIAKRCRHNCSLSRVVAASPLHRGTYRKTAGPLDIDRRRLGVRSLLAAGAPLWYGMPCWHCSALSWRLSLPTSATSNLTKSSLAPRVGKPRRRHTWRTSDTVRCLKTVAAKPCICSRTAADPSAACSRDGPRYNALQLVSSSAAQPRAAKRAARPEPHSSGKCATQAILVVGSCERGDLGAQMCGEP